MSPASLIRASTLALAAGMALAVLLFSQIFMTCFPPPKLAAAAALVGVSLAFAAAGELRPVSPSPLGIPLAAMLAWCLAGLARSETPEAFALSFTPAAAGAAAVLVAARLSPLSSERTRLLSAFVLAHAVCGIYAAMQYYGLDPFTWTLDYGRGRAFSTFGNPNFLGGQMVLAIPVLAAIGTESGGWLRWLARAAFALSFLAMVFAQTRSAWIGLVAGSGAALALAAWGRGSLRALLRPLGWAAGCGAALFLLFSFPALNPTGLSLPVQAASSFDLEQRSARQRFFWWKSAFDMARASPVIGHGTGDFTRLFPPFTRGNLGPFSDLSPAYCDHPHNDWLFLVCEHGIVGLGLLLWFAAVWLRACAAGARGGSLLHPAAAGGAIGLAVHAVWNMPSTILGTVIPAAVLAGMTATPPSRRDGTDAGDGSFHPVRGGILLAVALVLSFRPAVLLVAQDDQNGGRILKENRSWGPSAFLLRKAAALTRAPLRAHFMLGGVMYAQGFHREALEAFVRDELENPFGADSILHQAKALREMGQTEEAVFQCRRALKLVPNYSDAAITLASIRYRQAADAGKAGNRASKRAAIAAARVWVNYTLRYFPRDGEALLLLGHIEILDSRWREALAAWKRALEVRPSDDSLRYKVDSLEADLPRLTGRASRR